MKKPKVPDDKELALCMRQNADDLRVAIDRVNRRHGEKKHRTIIAIMHYAWEVRTYATMMKNRLEENAEPGK